MAARRRITIPLQGGLGNQLFQLAAGIAVGQRLGHMVHYSDYWLRNPLPGETPREFALSGLVPHDSLVHEPAPRTGRATDRIVRRRVIERSPDDDALARVTGHTRILAGYFQRLAYAIEAWPQLRESLATSALAAHRALVLPSPEPYGALHYRLGDYLASPTANAAHGVTSPEYFAAVVREGYDTLGISDWVVVSDDLPAAIGLLQSVGLPRSVELRTPTKGDEWSDLATLANAQVCAISNSSFSWWAAFIGSFRATTTVIAPRPWFADADAPEPEFFPQGWQRRQRSLLYVPNGSD